MTTVAIPRSLADALVKATGPVRLVDESGNLLGNFSPAVASGPFPPPTAEEIAEIKRRMASNEPRLTTEEVLEHLRTLEST